MVQAVCFEPIELALVVIEPVIVVCSRVGEALPWIGASYHWQRVRRSDRILPTPGTDGEIDSRLDLLLLEGNGGRVRASRSLHLPEDFLGVLNEAILEQSRYTYDPGEERRVMDSLLRRCPSPASLVAQASAKAHLVD